MASLSLASKVREHLTKLGDVVNTCYRSLYKDKSPLEVGDLYWHLKESVGKYELVLLRALNFNMYVQLPHSHLLHYLLALSRWVDEDVWQRSRVTQVSWALLQDSFSTSLCLREPPHLTATAVLYLALHCCQLQIPSEQAKRQWWQVFCPQIPEEKFQEVADKIMQSINAANGKET